MNNQQQERVIEGLIVPSEQHIKLPEVYSSDLKTVHA